MVGDGEQVLGKEEREKLFGFRFEFVLFVGAFLAFFSGGRFDGEQLNDARFLSDSAHELAVAEVDGINFSGDEHLFEEVGEFYCVGQISSGGGNCDRMGYFVAALAEEQCTFFTDADDAGLGFLLIEPDLGGFKKVSVVASAESAFGRDEHESDLFDFFAASEKGVRRKFARTTNAGDKFVHLFAIGARFLYLVFGFGKARSGDKFHCPGDCLGVLCRTDALTNLLERCHSRFWFI